MPTPHPITLPEPAFLLAAPRPAVPSDPPAIQPPQLDPGAWLTHTLGVLAGRPWLLAVAATAGIAALVLRQTVGNLRHLRRLDDARLITIAAPAEVDPAGATMLWANLAGILRPSRRNRWLHGAAHVVWQYAWAGRRVTISLWVPGGVPPGVVEAAVRAAWPGAAVTTEPAQPPHPEPSAGTVAVGGQLTLTDSEWLPINDQVPADPLRSVLSAATQLRDDEHAVVQILAAPATPRRYARARRAAARLRAGRPPHGGLDPAAALRAVLDLFLPGPARSRTASAIQRPPGVDRDVRLVLDKTAGHLWQTSIRYALATTTRTQPDRRQRAAIAHRLGGKGSGIAAAFAVLDGRNRLGRRRSLRQPLRQLADRRPDPGFLLAGAELAAIAGLPTDLAVPGLDRARAKAIPAPVEIPTGGRGTRQLGRAQVGGHKIALKVADARFHTHMVGQTGTGKTTLLANLALDDIRARRGVVVIDPHGDLVNDILDRIPAEHADRVWLFDPDQPNPPALNPLDGREQDKDLIVDNLVAIFSSIFSKAWGPRMDDVMRVSCLTLLRHPHVTLQHIPPLLNSEKFRARFTADLNDPDGLDGFWAWYDAMSPAMRAQVIGPVLSRLRSFLLRDFVRDTMRWPTSSFDMGTVIDGQILLVRIPKGVLGEDTSRILGSLILARVWQATLARAGQPPDKRRDASLYLDEAQNFLTIAASLDTMLAEARKYRLAITLAHQDLVQFPKELFAAVSANARNKFFFSVSPEDARDLARHTRPELDDRDLSQLDAYTAAARLMVDSRQTAPFTLTTNPPAPLQGAADLIRAAASARVPQQQPSAVDAQVEQAIAAEKAAADKLRRDARAAAGRLPQERRGEEYRNGGRPGESPQQDAA